MGTGDHVVCPIRPTLITYILSLNHVYNPESITTLFTAQPIFSNPANGLKSTQPQGCIAGPAMPFVLRHRGWKGADLG
jgi:hypothetical protein